MIGLREGWRRIKVASAVKSVTPEMWRVVNKLAVAEQYCYLGKGLCAFCGFRVENHAVDCIVTEARAAIAKATGAA